MPLFPSKDPNFSNPAFAQEFVQDAKTAHALAQKELIVNRAEQVLLGQRVQMMKGFVNDLPASDPQYSQLVTAIQMDQIELDELKTRELTLIQLLEKKEAK
ncbi:MAG: hypothetical protein KGJ02_02185 [Verrucomicrobiota bacterium]|nr:hypothetical protein [Verrucomicrobiota bacterium]